MSLRLLTITLILSLSLLAFVSSLGRVESQEIDSNEYITHRDLAIGYIIGRDGSLTAIVGLDTFTVSIPQIANQFWQSITKTVVNENITIIDYANGQNTVTLTLNMTDNILHFDLEGRLVDANLLIFQFSENTIRLGENRTGLRLANGRLFYFDWEDIDLQTEFIEGSKSLRVNIRSAPTFKLDPRISINNPDWETGDFTGWTTNSGADCAQSISSITPLNGSFSHLINSQAGLDDNCNAIQTIGNNPNVFMQAQFRIESAFTLDGAKKGIMGIRTGAGGSSSGIFRVVFNSTRSGLEIEGRFDTDSGDINIRNSSSPLINVGDLYCAEIHYHRNETAPNSGTFEIWLNQTNFITVLNIDNDGRTPPNRISSGQFSDLGSLGLVDMVLRTDDFYADNANRVNTCPQGLGPTPPVPPIIVENSLVPSGITFLMMFIILGLVALASNQPWFVIAGWLSMTIAFILFTTGLPFFAIDTNNNLVSFNTVFPQEFNTGVFTFFIIMQFVYPIRIVALVYERLKLIVFGLSDRFAS